MSDAAKTTLTDGSPVTADHREIDPATGMQKGYVVLSDEERAKGFVRPVRRSYVHVGRRPKYPIRNLTAEEAERHGRYGYVKFEEYPEGSRERELGGVGRFWTQRELTSGCGAVTTMGLALAETYARDPKFYGGTFCATCRAHFPVGADGEFDWNNEPGVKVGT